MVTQMPMCSAWASHSNRQMPVRGITATTGLGVTIEAGVGR
jgi:hypothetical protein